MIQLDAAKLAALPIEELISYATQLGLEPKLYPKLKHRPTLHAGQLEIKVNAKRFNCINCGRRFGKTILGEELVIEKALEGFPVAWFAPNFKTMTEVWRDLLKILQPVIVRKSVQDRRIDLSTGGYIELWALDKDPECARGRKYARVVIDEGAKIRQLLHAWTSTIRATLTDFKGDAFFLSTPKGRNDWYYLCERGWSTDQKFRNWYFKSSPTEANPHLDPQEIVDLREEVGPNMAHQEVDAMFLEEGGRFFDEWIETKDIKKDSLHEISSSTIDILPHWDCWGAFDWGKSAEFCFLLCVTDDNGNVIVIDEEYEAGCSDLQIIEKTTECIRRNYKLYGLDALASLPQVRIYADDSIFPPRNPKERIGEYTVEKYWHRGLNGMIPANKGRRVPGWNRVKEWMRFRDADGTPGLRVFRDKCPNLCRTIPLMVRKAKDPEDCESGGEDHACDTLRYAIQRPRPSILTEKRIVEPIQKFLIGWKEPEKKHYA